MAEFQNVLNKKPKLRINSQEGANRQFASFQKTCKNREGKTQRDRIPARNKGDRYLLIKRELDGGLRVDIYQNREGDKENEGESRKGNFPNQNERKDRSAARPIWFISSSRKEQEKCSKISERARLPARISHTLVFLPGKAGVAGAPPAPMTK